MGMVTSYSCKACGYATGQMFLGPAPHPEKFDPTLVSCASCKTLRVVDRPRVERGCGKHRKAFIVPRDEHDVSCPRCGKKLAATPVAIWD